MKARTLLSSRTRLFMTLPIVLILGTAGVLVSGISQAVDAAIKAGWYPHIVDADFVAEYATIPIRKDALIVDSRPAKKYEKGHIVPAVNIPYRKFDQLAHMLPDDKSALLVFYCGGLKCPLSHKSAFKAEKLGYSNIKVYAAGYPDWLKHGNTPGVGVHYVKNLIDTGAVAMLVDARPPKKFSKGSVPTAVNIPYRIFDKKKGFLPSDKGIELVFFCGGYKCPLSSKSADKAKAMGYTNVKLFQSGYPAWKQAFGVAAGSQPTQAAAKPAEDKSSMSIETFTRLMREEPDSVYWIDVRDRPEIAADGTFKLKTALTIPMDDFEAAIPNLPTDKPLVFFCNDGPRAVDAVDVLREKGSKLEVYFLEAKVEFLGQELPKVSAAE